MFEKIIFKNKEMCFCNSGKLFKDCCKRKQPKMFHTQGEALNVMGKIMKKSRVQLCLSKNCHAKGKNIIGAHALQENRILSKLQVCNYVYMQDFSKNPKLLEIKKGKPEPFYLLKKIHIKDATVAKCFCKTHDNSIFSKIEKSQYSLEELDKEQLFLFAYRTFSFEYYKEIVSKKFQCNMFKEVPQSTKNWMSVYKYRNTLLKLKDLEYYKDYFDESLENQDYSGVETCVIELPYRIQFANYMTIAPLFDIKGRKIKSIDKSTKRMKFLFLTIFPNENKSYILISTLKEDMCIYKELFNQLKTMQLGIIQFYLNVLIPICSENLIVSPKLWDKWTEIGQNALQVVVADPKSAKLMKYVQYYLKNIDKRNKKESIDIDSRKIVFDFFIPHNN